MGKAALGDECMFTSRLSVSDPEEAVIFEPLVVSTYDRGSCAEVLNLIFT